MDDSDPASHPSLTAPDNSRSIADQVDRLGALLRRRQAEWLKVVEKANARVHELDAEARRRDADLRGLEHRSKSDEAQLIYLRGQLAEQTALAKASTESLSAVTAQLKLAQAALLDRSDELQRLSGRLAQSEEASAGVKARLEVTAQEAERTAARLLQAQDRERELAQRLAEQRASLDRFKASLSHAKAELGAARAKLAAARDELAEQRRQGEELKQRLKSPWKLLLSRAARLVRRRRV